MGSNKEQTFFMWTAEKNILNMKNKSLFSRKQLNFQAIIIVTSVILYQLADDLLKNNFNNFSDPNPINKIIGIVFYTILLIVFGIAILSLLNKFSNKFLKN